MVNDAAYFLKIPYVWGSIYRFDGQASVFAPTLGDDAAVLPLPLPRAAAAGHGARAAPRAACSACCARASARSRSTEAIKLLTGIGDPLVGRLMIYDALEMEYRKLKVRKDPNCALCGEHPTVTGLIDYETFCGAVSEEAAEAAAGSTISVTQLEHMLKERDNGERDFVLVDVREPNEYEINQIPGSVLIPKGDFLNGVGPRAAAQSDKQIVHALQDRGPVRRDAGDRQGRGLRRRRARRRRRGRPGSTRSTPASRRTDRSARRHAVP